MCFICFSHPSSNSVKRQFVPKLELGIFFFLACSAIHPSRFFGVNCLVLEILALVSLNKVEPDGNPFILLKLLQKLHLEK